jgi:5-dehydro-2-deoxygluconokinase
MDRAADWQKVIAVTRRGGRDDVGTIVLGRAEDKTRVIQWLTSAAAVPGCIGFAVGRSTFWEPLVDWRDGRMSTAEASREVAERYGEWAGVFEGARISTTG